MLFITCDLFFIPISIILLLFFKYSYGSSSVVNEYSSTISSSQLNNGLLGALTAMIFLVFHLALTLAYKGFNFEIRHSYADKSFQAKSMPDVDLRIVFSDFLHCICFISFQQNHFLYYCFVNLIIFGYCSLSYLYYLPYYSGFMNCQKIFIYFDCFCISLFFITSNCFNDAAVVTILSIILQPVIFMLVKNAYFYRKAKIQEFKCYLESDLRLFELSARESLKADLNHSELIEKMYTHYSNKKEKLIFVYQSNFCMDVLKNHHLALVKSSQTNYKGLSIFTNFQIFKCQKKFEEINIKTSSGLRLFLYLHDLNILLAKDKNLCNFFLKFIDQILTSQVDTSNLFKSVKISADIIQSIRHKYESCLKKYPNSQIMNEMYGSLLSKILVNQEKGEKHLLRSLTCARAFSSNKESSIYLKKNLYYMVISGNVGETGKILYASNNLKALLGLNFDGEKFYYLAEFVPKPYSENHDSRLTRFIKNSLTNKLILDISLFLNNCDDFLTECFIYAECVGFESSVLFIAILDLEKNFEREAALIDENWEIFSHTRRFAVLIGQNKTKINKNLLSDFIPIDVLEELKEKEIMIYSFQSNSEDTVVNVGLILQKKQVFSHIVFTLYVVDDRDIMSLIEKLETMNETKKKKKIAKIFKLINENSTPNITTKKSQDEDANENDLEVLTRINTKQTQESSSSIQVKELRIVTESKKSLTVIKILIFLTVILTKVTLIAICNIILTVYIAAEVNSSNSLDSMIHLGDVSFYLSYLVLVTRSIDLKYRHNVPTIYTKNDLANMLPVLELYKNYTINDYNQ